MSYGLIGTSKALSVFVAFQHTSMQATSTNGTMNEVGFPCQLYEREPGASGRGVATSMYLHIPHLIPY